MFKKSLIMSLLICWPVIGYADAITVAAAANLQFTLKDLTAEFTKETGNLVKMVIGSSGKLTSQIENGAPFDVFMSADMKYPQTLAKEGFTATAPKIYAYGHLVLWTTKNMDLSKGVVGLSEPTFKKIAIASPKAAPYGSQAVNAMEFYHVYPDIRSKLVYGESIAQTNHFIMTGAADVGFTAKSVVMAANMQGKGKWVEVDSQSYEPIAQGMIVLKYGMANHAKLAKEFDDFLFSSAAQAIFKKYGYDLP